MPDAGERHPTSDDDDITDAMESLVLAHFCAGIDVTSAAYTEGLVTALDAIGNNIDDEPTEDPMDIKFAIHMQGGLIDGIYCNNKAGEQCEFSIFDYDTEDLSEDEVVKISNLNGGSEDAYVRHLKASRHVSIDLDDVFGAITEQDD